MSPSNKVRQVFKSSRHCKKVARELLEGIFVSEVLKPSQRLWIVSPWISDIPIIDNRSGSFWALDVSWAQKQIRLREVLLRIVQNGGVVTMVTRPPENEITVGQRLQREMDARGQSEGFELIHTDEDFHSKGLLGEDFYLMGSMNFTYNGLEINDETISLDRDRQRVAEARYVFENEYTAI